VRGQGGELAGTGAGSRARTRVHGPAGPSIYVLHGGPGAPGCAEHLAEALAEPLQVIEVLQRWSSDVPLKVEHHVEDLAELLGRHQAASSLRARPALVGESWGAMLALATAARHPQHVGGLLLIGCGTFDPEARAELHATLAARTTPELASALAEVERECSDPAERSLRSRRILEPIYTFERCPSVSDPSIEFDLKGHLESWSDMLRLQREGAYPRAFAAIECPVLMLHGSYDPHPGARIRDSLRPYLPQLEYLEFPSCGHSPWIERHARDAFLATARSWLAQTTHAT